MRWLRFVLSVLLWPFMLVGLNLYAWLIAPLVSMLAPGLRSAIEEGDLFEVSVPLEVTVLTHWQAPLTGGFKSKLAAGVRLRASTAAPAGSRSCTFVPHRQEDFQSLLVPAEDVASPKFSGVSIPLTSRRIQHCLVAHEPSDTEEAFPGFRGRHL